MKKFKALTADDFPGIDPVKFVQWRDVVVRMNKRWMIALWILLGLNVILIVVFPAVCLGGLLLIVIMAFVNRDDARTAGKLYKELGLNPRLIKAARKGELGTKVASPWAAAPPLLASVRFEQSSGAPPLLSSGPFVRSSGVPPPLSSSPPEIRRDPALEELIHGLGEYDGALQALVRGLESGHDRAALNSHVQRLVTLDLGRMLMSGGIFEITDQPSLARLKEILTRINTGAKAAGRQLEGGARAPASFQDIVDSASTATARGGNYPPALQLLVPNILMVTQSSLSHVEKNLSMSPTGTTTPSG
jgi:hypothetical protein